MNANDADTHSLTRILITALGCSEDLTRKLEQLQRENESLRHQCQQGSDACAQVEDNETVKQLRLENQTLQEELEKLRQKPDLSIQVGQLFKQNAEAQAEIDHLKSKIRIIQSKERKWRLKNPDISSPIISSDDADRMPCTPIAATLDTLEQTQHKALDPKSSARKRPRTQSPQPKSPLREISGNLPNGNRDSKASPKFKSRRVEDKGVAAIETLAEDGEDHKISLDAPVVPSITSKPDSAAHRRLQDLLTIPAPLNHLITRPTTADPNISVRRPQFLLTKQRPAVGPEDAEPFRSRPISRQNISHFKINPRYQDGQSHAFNDVVRNQEARKCLPGCTKPECCGGKFKAIADSLPRGPTDVSDDELLLEFMGPGSEGKIRVLTPLARKNLVHEARARRLANSFGKMHRSAFDRPKTPPGFWGIDFMGSQEERNSREQARVQEREEVEKRYQDALKGGGRWVFADE